MYRKSKSERGERVGMSERERRKKKKVENRGEIFLASFSASLSSPSCLPLSPSSFPSSTLLPSSPLFFFPLFSSPFLFPSLPLPPLSLFLLLLLASSSPPFPFPSPPLTCNTWVFEGYVFCLFVYYLTKKEERRKDGRKKGRLEGSLLSDKIQRHKIHLKKTLIAGEK